MIATSAPESLSTDLDRELLELDDQMSERLSDADVEELVSEERAKMLPDPSGYRLLIAIPQATERTEGGIYKPIDAMKTEQLSSVVGFVVKVGPDAYGDEKRFPSGPWCKEGDFVLFRAFTGTRIMVHGREFRMINDDSVEGIVQDPRGITRA